MLNKIYNILLYVALTLLVLVIALSIVKKANAVENRGVSFILSMCSDKAKQQKKLFNKIYEKATVLNAGWLYGATSNPDKCTWASKFYNDKRPKRVRIHVCNSTCFPTRGRTCQPKECFGGMKSEDDANKAILSGNKNLYARVDRIIEMIKSDYKTAPKDKDGKSTIVDFAVSPCMECTLSDKATIKLSDYIKTKLQSIEKERKEQGLSAITWVHNPLKSANCLKGYLCEKHGTPNVGKNGIADNDGVDYDTINQVDYWEDNQDAYMVLAWKPCLNGAADVAGTSNAGGKFIPPQNRTGYCTVNKEGQEFSPITNKDLDLTKNNDKAYYKANTTKGCNSFEPFDSSFVWKLADKERNFTTWLAPAKYKKFSKVELICDGAVVDHSYPQVGYRFGSPYSHDTPPQRKIYDFRKNIGSYPIKGFCVLHADKYCWRMQYPYFRPVKKN